MTDPQRDERSREEPRPMGDHERDERPREEPRPMGDHERDERPREEPRPRAEGLRVAPRIRPSEASGGDAESRGRDEPARESSGEAIKSVWPLYEVFLRGKRGLNHVHVGSLHAADADMALHNARDLYTRRNEGVSIWVVRSDAITASSPEEKDPFFAPSGDKVYRHPTFYEIPDDVPHI